MNRIRRILLSWAALSMLSMSALAQSDFPRKPVTLVNPYPPGGLADSTARQLAQRLSAVWGQSVVVDTKPGAAGNLAAQAVINAPADGYTLLFTIPEALSITKASGVKVGFDPAADLEPVALVALSTTVLIVPANSPHGSFKAFMEHAAQQPGTLNFGSQGQGSSFHLALEQLKLMSKTQIAHVPYKGAAAALTDLTAGRIDAMIATTQLALPNVQAGRVRVLAVTSGERLAQFPGAPTIAESGFAGFEYPVGLGVFVRQGTPVGLIQKINADVRKVMNEPSFVELLAKSATVTTDLGAQEFKSRWVRETKGYSDLIRTSNIKFE